MSTATVRAAFVPDADTVSWLQAREDFLYEEGHIPLAPAVKGAYVNRADGSGRVWCVWTRTQGRQLDILRFVIEEMGGLDGGPEGKGGDTERVEAVAVCLQAARREAGRCGLQRVQAWNPSKWVLAGARMLVPEVEVVDRESKNIVSVNWFGPEKVGEVELAASENFEWC